MVAAIYHPVEEVLAVTFDPMLVPTISHMMNGLRTTLDLPQLSYATIENSSLKLNFTGILGGSAYTLPYIQLQGLIEYHSDPSNGHIYQEPVTFPKIYMRHAEFALELQNTSLELTLGSLLIEGEEAFFQANISNIINFGPSADLTLVVKVDGAYLNFNHTEVAQIG